MISWSAAAVVFPVALFNFNYCSQSNAAASHGGWTAADRLLEETTACRLLLHLLLLLWWTFCVGHSWRWLNGSAVRHKDGHVPTLTAAVALVARCVPHSSDIQCFPPLAWRATKRRSFKSALQLTAWVSSCDVTQRWHGGCSCSVCSSTEYSVNIHVSLGGGTLDILTSIFDCRVSRCSIKLWLMFLWSVGPTQVLVTRCRYIMTQSLYVCVVRGE